jgi:hypothetical protein
MSARSRTRKPMLYMCLVLTVGSCDCDDSDEATDYVVTRADPNVDFSQFHTFRISDSRDADDLTDVRLDLEDIPEEARINIDSANDQARIELERIGLTEVDEDEDADLVVFTIAGTSDQSGYAWECVPGWYWWGWYWAWDACAWLAPIYVEYTVGSLALGLADPSEEDVVFGGLLQGVADGSGDTEDRIRDGVHVMFEDYPAPPAE